MHATAWVWSGQVILAWHKEGLWFGDVKSGNFVVHDLCPHAHAPSKSLAGEDLDGRDTVGVSLTSLKLYVIDVDGVTKVRRRFTDSLPQISS